MRTFAMSWKIVVLHPANGYPFNFWGIWYVIGNLSFKLYFMALWLFKVHYTKTHERKCEHASWFMATWTFDVICILHASVDGNLPLGYVWLLIHFVCNNQPEKRTKKSVCFLWKGCKPIAENWGTKFVLVADLCFVSGRVWTVSCSRSFWTEDEPHVLSPGKRARSPTRSGSKGNLMYPKIQRCLQEYDPKIQCCISIS